MKLGFLSDTHGLLRKEVVILLQGCDYICHAGDIGSEEILEQLQKIGIVYAVRGNNDRDQWSQSLPLDLHIRIDGINFYMVHDKMDIKNVQKDVGVILFGHSHIYSETKIDGIIYLNPGSCGRRRFSMPLTMATGEVSGTNMTIRKWNISEIMTNKK